MISFWLLTINAILVSLAILVKLRKTDILSLFAYTVFYFFGGYILTSALFFTLDKFQVDYVLLAMGLVNMSLVVWFYRQAARKDKVRLEIDPPKNTLYVFLVVVATVFAFNRFEFFGMGQDQGVYQTKAIQLVYGDTSQQLDFEEYSALATDGQRTQYRAFAADLLGFDNFDSQKPFLNSSDELSAVSGIFHGIPTFPAILALAISAFGLENMLVFQSVFYLALLVFALKTCENFRFSKLVSTIVVVAAVFSPIVLWVAKAALTEMLLALLVGVFIYYLTSPKDGAIINSTFPILIFSFFHISIYTIIPEVIVMYWLLYLTSRNKTYLKSNYLAMIFFAIGYLFMLFITPTYSFNNSKQVFFGPINEQTLVYFVALAVAICMGVNYALGRYFQSFKLKLDQSKIFDWLVKLAIAGMLLYTAYYGYKLVAGMLDVSKSAQSSYYYGKLAGLRNLTIVSFAYLSGGVILPVVFWKILTRTKTVLLENRSAILLFMFLYNILLTATFLRKEIFHYYYYARYLAPFVLIVTLLFGIYAVKFSKKILIGILALVSVYNGYYGYVMITSDDDSKITYSMIGEIAAELDDNAAIIMANGGVSRLLTLPLKAMANADIYPVFDDSLSGTIEFLEDSYQDIYIIANADNELEDVEGKIVYVNSYESSQDLNNYRNSLVPLPQAFTKENVDIIMAKALTAQTVYSMSDNDISLTGFGSLEGNFRWTIGKEAILDLYMEKGDYDLVVNQMPYIPFENLSRQSVNVDFYINEVMAGSHQVTELNKADPIVIPISGDLVNENENVLKMVIDTWSPQEFGVDDNRDLGIAVESIQFVKK